MAEENLTSRERAEKRLAALKTERSSFDGQWQELAQFVRPRKGRFQTTDRNRGDKRWNSIINNQGTTAHRKCTAGLFNGIMSPTRPWFKLETMDPAMMTYQPVKLWLEKVELIIREIFNSGNLYSMAPSMLGELTLFGTGAMFHDDDFEDVARFYTWTIGSYWIAQDDKQRVNTVFREFEMPTVNIVRQFGLDNLSRAIKNQWDRGDYYSWNKVVHCIEPNANYTGASELSQNKRFRSCYFDPSDDDRKRFLRVKGYDGFYCYAPRWEVTGEDVYGTECPGMIALGDIKGLQVMEKRTAQAIDKSVNPPLHGPGALKTVQVNSLPGGVTVYDTSGTHELKPIYKVDPNISGILEKTNSQERRINVAFYVDLFEAMANIEGIQPRNELDIMQRQEEKLVQLGPVLERTHGELLSPIIDRTFAQALAAKILPPAPPELQGQVLKVRYISMLATAQRAVQTQAIDRLTGYIGGLAKAGAPEAFDKLNVDNAVERFGSLVGAPVEVIRSDEEVAQLRQSRAQAQQQASQAQMGEMGSKSIKNIADAAGAVGLGVQQ
jgi:hypothetical protein